MVCSTMLWRATAKSSSSTAIGASATGGCCRRARCASPRPARRRGRRRRERRRRAYSTAPCSMRLLATSAVGDEIRRGQTAARVRGPTGACDRRHRQSAAILRHAARHRHQVVEHPLPDHARLRVDDISFADDLPVLMTEKDAVKCAGIRRAASLVRAGDRELRRRRSGEAARHRDSGHVRSARRAREGIYG